MAGSNKKAIAKRQRSMRVRSRIRGTSERPRLSVFRSNRNLFAQIIDDSTGATLVAASTLDKDFRKQKGSPFTIEIAQELGKRLAERAREKQVSKVVFDRGPYLYHGKVRAFANGAREGGLDF